MCSRRLAAEHYQPSAVSWSALVFNTTGLVVCAFDELENATTKKMRMQAVGRVFDSGLRRLRGMVMAGTLNWEARQSVSPKRVSAREMLNLSFNWVYFPLDMLSESEFQYTA
jgi:hypothetical protein